MIVSRIFPARFSTVSAGSCRPGDMRHGFRALRVAVPLSYDTNVATFMSYDVQFVNRPTCDTNVVNPMTYDNFVVNWVSRLALRITKPPRIRHESQTTMGF
jgi:hypothetical protein